MTKPADEVLHRHFSEEEFKPGVYQHWKGGLYRAIALGWANETIEITVYGRPKPERTRERVVIYLSMTTGEFNTRPLNHDSKDAWNDSVYCEGRWVDRFRFVDIQPVPT